MPKTSADVPNQSGTPPTVWPVDSQADFRTDRRMLLLSALAVPIGVIGAMVAKALPWSIAFFTDLSFFHRFPTQTLPPENHHLGWWLLLAPATGALIVGLMRVMARPRSVDNRMTGSLPKRIERLQKLRNLYPEAAAKCVRKEDRGRERYVKAHFAVRLDNELLYDLVINTDRISNDDAVALIVEGAQRFFSAL